MTQFTVYSASTTPNRLYSTDESDGGLDTSTGIGVETTVETAWAGDRPHDFVADLGARRLWWTFQADRETKARRTGRFVAAYQGGPRLFRGLAEELRRLHDTDGWTVPHRGDTTTDVGYYLWRLPSTVEREDAFERLVERLQDGSTTPLRVGTESYRTAFTTVRALEDAGVECTVAVDERGSVDTGEGVDLLLVPGAGTEFETLSAQGTAPSETATVDTRSSADTSARSEHADTGPGSRTGEDRTADGLAARVAGVVLVGLLGFSAFSLLTRRLLEPVSGLAAFGGSLGALCAVSVWHATSGSGEQLGRWLRSRGDWTLTLVSLGTLAGFSYPRLFWEMSLLLGSDGPLFGSLTKLSGSVPATAVYVGGLFALTVVTVEGGAKAGRLRVPTNGRLRLSVAFVVYGLCLFTATGLAQLLWYDLVPVV